MNQKTMPTTCKENKMNGDVSVAVVTASSRKRDSLQTLLRAVPRFRMISQAYDALRTLKSSTDHPPDLLVLDVGPDGDEAWEILRQVKAEWPQTRCLILVDISQQRQMARDAKADEILVNGFSIDEFFTLVDRLLSRGDSLQP